jgi:hypothetical protein
MSERLLKEFRERAELLVPVPDWHELQQRGTARRRVRLAVGAAVLASAMTIGGVVVATTIDDEGSIRPAQIGPTQMDPTPPPSAEVCELENYGNEYGSVPSGCELPAQVDVWSYVEPGPYFVRPFNTDLRTARPGDLEAWFEIGDAEKPWYWWGGGISMAGRGPEFAPYIRVVITPIIGVHSLRCQSAEPEPVRALPSSSLSVAQELVVSPDVEVLEPPRSVQKFGFEAAHVRFTVTGRCPSEHAFILWRAFEPEDDIFLSDDISAGRRDADIYIEGGEHVFDVWVIDVQGNYLVIGADQPVGAREADVSEMQEQLDSIRFEFTE